MIPGAELVRESRLDHCRQQDRADRHHGAGEEPETAANSAQASTPARPRPPCQWPTIDEANLIMRRRRRRGSGRCRRG